MGGLFPDQITVEILRYLPALGQVHVARATSVPDDSTLQFGLSLRQNLRLRSLVNRDPHDKKALSGKNATAVSVREADNYSLILPFFNGWLKQRRFAAP